MSFFTPREPTKFFFSTGQRIPCTGGKGNEAAVCAVPAVFDESECAALIKEAEAIAAKKGWHHRGASLPTDDLLVSDLCESSRILIKKRIDCLLHVGAAEGLVRSSKLPTVTEMFLIKYGGLADCTLERRTSAVGKPGALEKIRCRDALRKHQDNTALTINVSLSSEWEYVGGGTRFFASDRKELTIRNAAGSALLHDGDIEHAGVAVKSGKRYLLVAFCKNDGSRSAQPVPPASMLPKMHTIHFPRFPSGNRNLLLASRLATANVPKHGPPRTKARPPAVPPPSALSRLLTACSLNCMLSSIENADRERPRP